MAAGPHRELALAKPVLSGTIKNGSLELSSPAYCHDVHIEDGGYEVLAENYFDLLPGTSGTYTLTAVTPIEWNSK